MDRDRYIGRETDRDGGGGEGAIYSMTERHAGRQTETELIVRRY